LSRDNDVFKALADPTRRTILETLRVSPGESAGQIAGRFPEISRAAVSKHLGVLRHARLVRAREAGREVHYTVIPGPLAVVYREWLAQFEPLWDESLARLKRQAEREEP